jgi:hypothetical protein
MMLGELNIQMKYRVVRIVAREPNLTALKSTQSLLWRTKQKCRFWIKQLPCIKTSLHRSDFVQQNVANYIPTPIEPPIAATIDKWTNPRRTRGHGEREKHPRGRRQRKWKSSWKESDWKSVSACGRRQEPPPSGDKNPVGEGVVNPLFVESRLNEAIATLDEKYEEKYNQLQQEIQQKDKGRNSLVDNLLNKSSMFTKHIMSVQLPEKFKMLSIQLYTGIEDPT